MWGCILYGVYLGTFLPFWLGALQLLSMLVGNFFHCSAAMSPRVAVVLFIWSTVSTGIMETIGINTGWPFGPYHYADDILGPKLPGGVPVMVPLSYFMNSYPVFVLSNFLFFQVAYSWPHKFIEIAFIPAINTFLNVCFDMAIDPSTTHLKYYIWEDYTNCNIFQPSSKEYAETYFCVPIVNFKGWFITTGILYYPFYLYLKYAPPPREYFESPLGWIYQSMGLAPFAGFFLTTVFNELTPSLRLISFFVLGLPISIALVRWLQYLIGDCVQRDMPSCVKPSSSSTKKTQ